MVRERALRSRHRAAPTSRAACCAGRVIHEFDPWFNYRATEYMAANGWTKFQVTTAPHARAAARTGT